MYLHFHVSFDSGTASECSCSEEVGARGYGNCHQSYNGPICYVNEPTTCTDVVNAGGGGRTGYSWEACQSRTGNV